MAHLVYILTWKIWMMKVKNVFPFGLSQQVIMAP